MSITRSSIPVCINCSAPCASRRVPPLCVTASHSSPVPHRPLSVTLPVLSLSRWHSSGPPFLPQVPQAAGVRDSWCSAIPARSSSKNTLSTPFPLPTYFFSISISFSILCFPLFLICLTHPFPSHSNFCSLRMHFSIKLLSQCCCISR